VASLEHLELYLSVFLIIGMVAFIEAGYRIGRRALARDPRIVSEVAGGIGTVETVVFGLLGLTLAFTFSGASDRLAVRRAQIVQEANAIGTAYLRVDVLPAAERDALRALYREYLEVRIEVYDKFLDEAARTAALDRGDALQRQIWSRSVAACQQTPNATACLLVLPALNDMFDITTTRLMAAVMHVPIVIIALLVTLAFLGAVLSGYTMALQGKRNAMRITVFAIAIAATIYVVLDLEFPRAGLINLTSIDRAIVQLRGLMK
jgi:hypothetical protein